MLWRVGDWDGKPLEFLNGQTFNVRHPSDARNAAWGPVTYAVGSATNKFPAAIWKDQNSGSVITFALSAAQVAARTLRIGIGIGIGISTALANGRPQVPPPDPAAPLPSSAPEPWPWRARLPPTGWPAAMRPSAHAASRCIGLPTCQRCTQLPAATDPAPHRAGPGECAAVGGVAGRRPGVGR